MESIAKLRQDEALRFMKCLAQNPDKAINIWNISKGDSNDTMVIKGIQDIKDNEFYFMLPFILDSS